MLSEPTTREVLRVVAAFGKLLFLIGVLLATIGVVLDPVTGGFFDPAKIAIGIGGKLVGWGVVLVVLAEIGAWVQRTPAPIATLREVWRGDQEAQELETDGGSETKSARLEGAITRTRNEYDALGHQINELAQLSGAVIEATDEELEREATVIAVSKVLTAIWGHHPKAPVENLEADQLLRKLAGSFDEEAVADAVERAGWSDLQWRPATDDQEEGRA